MNNYLIQDVAGAGSTAPLPARLEVGFWYFFYFATERGRAGLTLNRRDIARIIWERNSPRWPFTDAELDRAAEAFENPDYVDVVIHSYRHRLGLARAFRHTRDRTATGRAAGHHGPHRHPGRRR